MDHGANIFLSESVVGISDPLANQGFTRKGSKERRNVQVSQSRRIVGVVLVTAILPRREGTRRISGKVGQIREGNP